MKKITDFRLIEKKEWARSTSLLLQSDEPLEEIKAGQFVQVRVDDAQHTYLRRPISIHDVDYQNRTITLLVLRVGEGTNKMSDTEIGDTLNIIYPLGNGFTIPVETQNVASVPEMQNVAYVPEMQNVASVPEMQNVASVPEMQNVTSVPEMQNVASVPEMQNVASVPEMQNVASVLLIGGGIGIAPLYYLGKMLKEKGVNFKFLLGGRSKSDLIMLEEFASVGEVLITTNDGSLGEQGFVTQHSVWQKEKFDMIYTCGPKPMMMAVTKIARENNIECEVSLENLMACGLGACLCCVENTIEGNVCVCKEGPVMNINKLLW